MCSGCSRRPRRIFKRPRTSVAGRSCQLHGSNASGSPTRDSVVLRRPRCHSSPGSVLRTLNAGRYTFGNSTAFFVSPSAILSTYDCSNTYLYHEPCCRITTLLVSDGYRKIPGTCVYVTPIVISAILLDRNLNDWKTRSKQFHKHKGRRHEVGFQRRGIASTMWLRPASRAFPAASHHKQCEPNEKQTSNLTKRAS